MTSRVARSGMLEDEGRVSVCMGKICLSVLMAGVMCLHCSMQEEAIPEHTNGKCHLRTL